MHQLNNMMGAYWVIMDRDQNILMEKELFIKEWELNTPRTAEVTILLGMIQTINNKSYNVMNMELIVAIDNDAV